ncbi:MAG: DNA polymerase III subunit delta [Bacteroidales bacterium]|nr:DNA polymerase III subunit delta [Bacteroidales bacterium]
MAKSSVQIPALCAELVEDARKGIFKPVYLLMGDEPYYPDLVCSAVVENCVEESFKDFNEYIFYGADTDADTVVSAARQYPMMSERILVVVKEAQLMKDIETLQYYCQQPLDSTVLVVLLHKGAVDKRKAFYKSVQKCGGAIVESPSLRDYEIADWIVRYYRSRGLTISPEAATLMGESTGTELGTIVVETDKLVKNLPEGVDTVTVEDVEKNVGISRQFSVFELNRELAARNAAKAVRIATHIGSAARFAMPMAVSVIFSQFYKVLRYAALLQRNPRPSGEEKAAALAGVNPYFYRDYDMAVRNYPLPKCMQVISILNEYDYKGKGGDGGDMDAGTLLVEMVTKILNV